MAPTNSDSKRKPLIKKTEEKKEENSVKKPRREAASDKIQIVSKDTEVTKQVANQSTPTRQSSRLASPQSNEVKKIIQTTATKTKVVSQVVVSSNKKPTDPQTVSQVVESSGKDQINPQTVSQVVVSTSEEPINAQTVSQVVESASEEQTNPQTLSQIVVSVGEDPINAQTVSHVDSPQKKVPSLRGHFHSLIASKVVVSTIEEQEPISAQTVFQALSSTSEEPIKAQTVSQVVVSISEEQTTSEEQTNPQTVSQVLSSTEEPINAQTDSHVDSSRKRKTSDNGLDDEGEENDVGIGNRRQSTRIVRANNTSRTPIPNADILTKQSAIKIKAKQSKFVNNGFTIFRIPEKEKNIIEEKIAEDSALDLLPQALITIPVDFKRYQKHLFNIIIL